MKMSLEKSGEKKLRNKNLTVPNAMSVFRILVIPFFAYFFLTDHLAAAVVALLLSGLSDALDGLVARRFNQITELGKMLDPLADKLTQGAVAVCIAIRYPSICPLLFLLVTKELVMLCGVLPAAPRQEALRGQVVRQGFDHAVLRVDGADRRHGRLHAGADRDLQPRIQYCADRDRSVHAVHVRAVFRRLSRDPSQQGRPI